MFENISSGSDLKPLLIVLKFGPKWFWFQTTAEKVLSAAVQN
jgi:hypothetical protein